VLLRFDACLKLDFLAPAVLTILVGGFMRLAFFAGGGLRLLAFTVLVVSNRILRSFALNL
jgi:hypothetical protein